MPIIVSLRRIKVKDRFPGHLFLGQAHGLGQGLVGLNKPVLPILIKDHGWHRIQDDLEFLLLPPQSLFGLAAGRDVVDNGVEQIPALEADGSAVNLHVPHVAPGQAVPEEKMAALQRHGPLHLLKYLVPGEQVDIGDAPGNEFCMSAAVISTGRRVGIHNAPGGRVDQQHHRMVMREKAAVACLALLQIRLGLPALGNVGKSSSA